MGNKMLIDATHPEETRVVVLRGHRVEEFDFESASRKQLRGNIYLAKVTRVEPSLQAAFVNYGGNRHGFLAFSEIHPDYYQLPMAERQALKREEERDSRAAARGGESYTNGGNGDDDHDEPPQPTASMIAAFEPNPADDFDDDEDDQENQTAALEAALPVTKYSGSIDDGQPDEAEARGEIASDYRPAQENDDFVDLPAPVTIGGEEGASFSGEDDDAGDGEEAPEADHVESVGSEDALEELPQRHRRRRRIYKIQEVIKRGQIMLVQVVKEERGNKGAALTTYLSLAGRYTVLMPNTASGGGISRKIASPADRKRLREIASELEVSDGMGLIIRTAGAARTKTEIKRDYEYLLRLWENVRDLTLNSTAPCLVYEEGDLIKRSIRDLYNREIDEVLVAGDDAYKDAKEFMRMLMPSHAKNVQPYKDPEPVFTRYEVERQLNAMFSPQVTLPSGGYIIINQTEALVAVDVNSGKSTREFSIEDTALKTNLEAAEEISRQLRLRDLAGLIVVDFIDMEERRNNRSVERKLKECLRNDRARIQVGRISHFGLLEMSRQRIRTGMVEGSTTQCAHCQGTGFVRSTESVALSVLRSLEDWLRTNTPCDLNAVSSPEVALYILNQKRTYLRDIESRHGVVISVTASDRMHGANFYIEKVSVVLPGERPGNGAVSQSDRIIVPFESDQGDGGDDKNRRSRRKRRRRGRGGDEQETLATSPVSAGRRHAPVEAAEDDEDDEDTRDAPREARQDTDTGEDGGKSRRRSRRRGRRGGRHQRGGRNGEAVAREGQEADAEGAAPDQRDDFEADAEGSNPLPVEASPAAEAAPASTPAPVYADAEDVGPAETPAHTDKGNFRSEEPRAKAKPNGIGHAHADHAEPVAAERGHEALEPAHEAETAVSEPAAQPDPKSRGSKRGWWQKRT
jgi:ribonuclease E